MVEHSRRLGRRLGGDDDDDDDQQRRFADFADFTRRFFASGPTPVGPPAPVTTRERQQQADDLQRLIDLDPVLARHFSQLGRALCAKAVLRPPRRRRAG